MDELQYTLLRQQMIREQLEPRDKRPGTQSFWQNTPAPLVAEENRHLAYRDFPLSIGEKQTISQPYIVALMTQSSSCGEMKSAGNRDRIRLPSSHPGRAGRHVFTVERIKKLSLRARAVLERLGYNNISYKTGDGAAGWPEKGPFDGILVTAAATEVPTALIKQLRPGGCLVIPVGNQFLQDLLLIIKEETGIKEHRLCGCRFVPLIPSD